MHIKPIGIKLKHAENKRVRYFIHALRHAQVNTNLMQDIFGINNKQAYRPLNKVSFIENQGITNVNHPQKGFHDNLFSHL